MFLLLIFCRFSVPMAVLYLLLLTFSSSPTVHCHWSVPTHFPVETLWSAVLAQSALSPVIHWDPLCKLHLSHISWLWPIFSFHPLGQEKLPDPVPWSTLQRETVNDPEDYNIQTFICKINITYWLRLLYINHQSEPSPDWQGSLWRLQNSKVIRL